MVEVGGGARATPAGLRVPLGPLTAGLAALGVLEVLIAAKDGALPAPAVAAVLAATAPLLLVRRAPLSGLVAVLAAILAARGLGVGVGVVWPALLVAVAAFASGLSTEPRRAAWLVPIGAAYVAVRWAQPRPDAIIVVLAGARYAAAAGGGVLIRRRLDRVAALLAERDALRRAVDAGPGEAVAAEQLRVWSAVQPRTDRVVAELPGHAALAAEALRDDPAAAVRHLEAIRALALEAFEGMRATVRALDPEPGRGTPALVPAAAEERVRTVLEASLGSRRRSSGVLLAEEVAGSLERFVGIVGRRGQDARELRARVRGDELRLTLRLARSAVGEEELAALRLLGGRVRLQGGRLDLRRGPGGTRLVLALPVGRPADGGERPRSRRARPRPGPLAAVCALLVAGALTEQAIFAMPGPAAAGWGVAASLGLVPLLAPRRPLLASLLTGAGVLAASAAEVVGGPTTTQNFVGALVVAVAGATASLPRAALALVAVTAGMLGGLWAEPSPWEAPAYLGLGLTLVGAWAAGIGLRRVAQAYRLAREEGREAGAALSELERLAVLGERLRLAGELHDLVGHALTSIVVQAGGASAQAARGRPQAAASIAALAGAADLAVHELARLARVLELAPEPPPAGAGELEAIVAHARRAGQAVQCTLEGPLDAVAPEVGRSVERIVQEALTNAAKHAAGAPVEVSVRVEPDGEAAALRIANGPGRAEGVGGGGHGLRSMSERARRCGGDLEAGRDEDGGWVVQARLGAGATAPDGVAGAPFGR